MDVANSSGMGNIFGMLSSAGEMTPVGAGISAGMGMIQMIKGFVDKKKANDLMGQAEDLVQDESSIPTVSSSLLKARSDYNRKKVAIGTGIEYKNEIDTLRNIVEAGAKRSGGASTALINRLTGQTINQALGKTMDQQKFFETLSMKANEDVANQEWATYKAKADRLKTLRDLKIIQAGQLSGDSATNKTAGIDNLLGGMMSQV